MRFEVHVPTEVTAPQDWSPVLRARLQRMVARAIERAATQVGHGGIQVELVRGAPPAPSTVRGQATPRGTPRERLDAARLRRGGEGYGVPSYQDAGAEVEVPVQGLRFTEGISIEARPRTEHELVVGEDRIVRRAFSRATVIQAGGNFYVYAGGNPHVVARNLARGIAWGESLFGGKGYAVFLRHGAPARGPFYVAGLEEVLSIHDLGGLNEQHITRHSARMVSPSNYTTVTVVTREGTQLHRLGGRGVPWTLEAFQGVLGRIPEEARGLSDVEMEYAASFLASAVRAGRGTAGMLELIVDWDRTLFAAIPWERRAGYLELLIHAWTDVREETAILELIYASRSTAELEAIFAILRQGDTYAQLFDDLDEKVYELCQFLGEFHPTGALDWRYLVSVLRDMNLLPTVPIFGSVATDPLRELQRMVGGVLDWFQSTLIGIRFLFTRPGEVMEGLAHLTELLWVIERARWGDPQAQALVTQMLRQAGLAVAKAIRGMQYAEGLGTPYGQRGGGAAITGDILGRLRYALVFEVLTWFIGIGEIKAAMQAAELPERIAALGRALRVLRFTGRVAEGGEVAARLERVLTALARLAELDEAARAARLVEFLPEEHAALLARIAETVDLPEGAGIEALRAALGGNRELLGAVDRLGDALAMAGRLEARAGQVTAEMALGMRALLRHAPLERPALLRLIDDVPVERLGEFMHTMRFVHPDDFARWNVQFLGDLGRHPRALALVREAGSGLADDIYRRTGDWQSFDRFLEGLSRKREQVGNPADYQRFLDRLRNGEAAAFDEVAEVLHAQQFAEATRTGRTAAYGMARLQRGRHTALLEEMDEIASHSVTLLNRRASQLAQLTDKELDGLEQIARLESGRVDWADTLDTVSRWPPNDRGDLLGLAADVGPHTAWGLEDVMRGILGRDVSRAGAEIEGVKGSFGQLYAARTLINRYGARGLRFEVTQVTGGLRRDVDIIANAGSGRLRVEVKTNTGGRPSFEREQILKDLVAHAPTRYDDLLYMYHPSVAGQPLTDLGQDMLGLFNSPELRQLFQSRGLNINQARQDFQRWLANRGLTTYSL